jgi:hypothetical protein
MEGEEKSGGGKGAAAIESSTRVEVPLSDFVHTTDQIQKDLEIQGWKIEKNE